MARAKTTVVVEEVKNPATKEVTLKKAAKGTHIVFLGGGKFVEFKDGKAVVETKTAENLEKLGVI